MVVIRNNRLDRSVLAFYCKLELLDGLGKQCLMSLMSLAVDILKNC